MKRKLTQPSMSSLRKLVSRHAATDGTKSSSKVATAFDAKYVCTPYHTMPTTPRISAARFAPITPIETRAITGKGMPCLKLGLPTQFISTYTMRMPMVSASSTCQPEMPSRKRLAAKV